MNKVKQSVRVTLTSDKKMAARMNSEEALKAFCAMESKSELSSLACTSSKNSKSDEEPCEKDFSDQGQAYTFICQTIFFEIFYHPD